MNRVMRRVMDNRRAEALHRFCLSFEDPKKRSARLHPPTESLGETSVSHSITPEHAGEGQRKQLTLAIDNGPRTVTPVREGENQPSANEHLGPAITRVDDKRCT